MCSLRRHITNYSNVYIVGILLNGFISWMFYLVTLVKQRKIVTYMADIARTAVDDKDDTVDELLEMNLPNPSA